MKLYINIQVNNQNKSLFKFLVFDNHAYPVYVEFVSFNLRACRSEKSNEVGYRCMHGNMLVQW